MVLLGLLLGLISRTAYRRVIDSSVEGSNTNAEGTYVAANVVIPETMADSEAQKAEEHKSEESKNSEGVPKTRRVPGGEASGKAGSTESVTLKLTTLEVDAEGVRTGKRLQNKAREAKGAPAESEKQIQVSSADGLEFKHADAIPKVHWEKWISATAPGGCVLSRRLDGLLAVGCARQLPRLYHDPQGDGIRTLKLLGGG